MERNQNVTLEDGGPWPRLVIARHPRSPGLADDGDAGWPGPLCGRPRSGQRPDRARPEAVSRRHSAVRASVQQLRIADAGHRAGPGLRDVRVAWHRSLDTTTGKVVWERRDLECNHFRGAGSSPIIFGDLLIMHFDGSDVHDVVALDKRTGKTVWRTPRSIDFKDLNPNGTVKADGDFRKAFSTPQIVTTARRAGDGEPRLAGRVRLRPAHGKELWRLEERSSRSASTRPVVYNGLVIYPTGFDGAGLPCGRTAAVTYSGPTSSGVSHVEAPKPSLTLARGPPDRDRRHGHRRAATTPGPGAGVEGPRPGSYSASPLHAEDASIFFSEDGKATVIEAGSRVQSGRRKQPGRRVHGFTGRRRPRDFPPHEVASVSHRECDDNRGSGIGDRGSGSGIGDRGSGLLSPARVSGENQVMDEVSRATGEDGRTRLSVSGRPRSG